MTGRDLQRLRVALAAMREAAGAQATETILLAGPVAPHRCPQGVALDAITTPATDQKAATRS